MLRSVLAPYSITQISFSSPSEALSPSAGSQTTFFRTCTPNSRQLAAAAQLVQQFGWKELALISSTHCNSGAEILSSQAGVYGYTVRGAVDDVKVSSVAERGFVQEKLKQLIDTSFTTVFILILSNDETWLLSLHKDRK